MLLAGLIFMLGALMGGADVIIIAQRSEGSTPISKCTAATSSESTRAAFKHFHELIWRSYGLFIAGIALIAGWYAEDLAKSDNLAELTKPGSFISLSLLVFVIAVSVLLMWAAYVSYTMWLLNKVIAETERAYRTILIDARRIAYNAMFALIVDLLLLAVCVAILIHYADPGDVKAFALAWNVLYYLAAFMLGLGSCIRVLARLDVNYGLSSFVGGNP